MQHANLLLVEGKDDVYAVSGLLSNFVSWGPTENEWPVFIKAIGSDAQLLAEGVIPTHIKQSDLRILGVLIDANTDFDSRWQRIRQLCREAYAPFPERIPPEGLVHDQAGLPRVGVWIMPDNRSRGMLETFLGFLVPGQSEALWARAIECATGAKSMGAPYRDVHQDKARIHTWLAWQDPPGRPLGEALKSRCLDPGSPFARPFVDWFVGLFRLESRRI